MGIKVGPEHEDLADNHGLQPGDMATDGAERADDLNVHIVASNLNIESTHIVVPE